jgi:DNA-binding NarL/FixJ family response regulator
LFTRFEMTLPHERTAVVVDDHPLVARGITDYLRVHCAFTRVDAIFKADDLWAHIAQHGAPTLALLDFWLAGGTALSTLMRLRDEHPATRLLVISGDGDPAVRDKLRRLSVDGFLLKQAEPAVFAQAVAAVLRGETWFDDAPAATADSERDLPLSAAELGLTTRQAQVLALMLKGLPNKRVAQALALTEPTVKEHVSGILERLGARNRIELITRLKGKRIDV